jgi:hypothetical protein
MDDCANRAQPQTASADEIAQRVVELLLPKIGDASPVGNDFPSIPSEVAAPSKRELVRQWFEKYPNDRGRTGRDLQENAKPMGVKISYRYWNDGKK